MKIGRNDADLEEILGEGKVVDYPVGEEVGLSVQELNGRVPEKGFYRNSECLEVCYVKSGEAEVTIDGETFSVSDGDVYVIQAGEKSCVTAEDLEVVVFTRPDWYEEQCKIVD